LDCFSNLRRCSFNAVHDLLGSLADTRGEDFVREVVASVTGPDLGLGNVFQAYQFGNHIRRNGHGLVFELLGLLVGKAKTFVS
jgi:hypothetical protein